METKTVLVVDDEPAVRAYVASALGKQGYRTVQASNAAEALELAAKNPLDLVVTDVVMPGMSGPDLVRELQRRGCRAHYLLMSGYADTGNAERGDLPLLSKPFTLNGLLDAVRGVAGPRPPQPENGLFARLREAERAYRVAAREHEEAISEARLRILEPDPDGCYALKLHARNEREALENYTRQVRAMADSVLHGKAPGPETILTTREFEVLKLIAAGLSTREIAARLGITFKTAATHRAHVMEKLDLHDVASVVRYAIRHKLVEP